LSRDQTVPNLSKINLSVAELLVIY